MLGGRGKGPLASSLVDELTEYNPSPVDVDGMLVGDYVDRQVSGQAIRNNSGDLSRFFEGMLDYGPIDLSGMHPQTVVLPPPESATEWPTDVVVPTPQVQIGR